MPNKRPSAPQLSALNLIAEATRKRRRIWRWIGGMSNSLHKSAEVLAKQGYIKAVQMPRSPNQTWRMEAEGWELHKRHFPS